jgi:hypothetical protein
MNENHVIDSWIAELGLSGRRSRRSPDRTLRQASPGFETPLAGREARHAAPARADFGLGPRYQVVSSPC